MTQPKPNLNLIEEPIVMEKKSHADVRKKLLTINSHELLKHEKEVFIMHKGDQYHLRCTRSGKLILTK